MDGRWNEGMSEAVHGSPGYKTGCIAVIVDKGGSSHGRARGWFRRNNCDISPINLVQDKRKGNASEITPSTSTSCHHIDLFLPKFLQLFLCLKADNRLMHEHVAQNTSQ